MTDRTMTTELPSTPEKLSLPKDKIRVLLLEGINDSAVELMQAAGYTNLDAPAEGARRRRAARGAEGRPHPRHPLAHAADRRRSLPPTG